MLRQWINSLSVTFVFVIVVVASQSYATTISWIPGYPVVEDTPLYARIETSTVIIPGMSYTSLVNPQIWIGNSASEAVKGDGVWYNLSFSVSDVTGWLSAVDFYAQGVGDHYFWTSGDYILNVDQDWAGDYAGRLKIRINTGHWEIPFTQAPDDPKLNVAVSYTHLTLPTKRIV